MFIRSIKLQNIRGFKNLKFSLDRGEGTYSGWTVITGDNGSGKSSLLKAVALGLAGKENGGKLQPSFRGWIREGSHRASIELECVRTPGDDEFAGSGKVGLKPFPAKIEIVNGSKEPSLAEPIPSKKPVSYVSPQRSIWSGNSKGWFSCGYGPFRRLFGASPDATRSMVAASTERFVTMFQEAASLGEVDQWLKDLNHKKLEGKASESKQLELLLEIFQDELTPNQITVDGVDSDGLWLRDRNGLRLSWGEMSDGYRSALALLTDILRHLIKTYGSAGLTSKDSQGKTFVKRSGVVLIDEIDAHLHPEWQREIGFWLKRHFPNIQFIVTTHSPIICQAADENGLFHLPEPGSGESPRALTKKEHRLIISSKSDVILRSPAFGLQNTRSPKAVTARADYAKLMAKRRTMGKLSNSEIRTQKELEVYAFDEVEK